MNAREVAFSDSRTPRQSNRPSAAERGVAVVTYEWRRCRLIADSPSPDEMPVKARDRSRQRQVDSPTLGGWLRRARRREAIDTG